jgi:hypothetical protein
MMFLIVAFVTTADPLNVDTPSERVLTFPVIALTPAIAVDEDEIVTPTAPIGDCEPPIESDLSFLQETKAMAIISINSEILVFIN